MSEADRTKLAEAVRALARRSGGVYGEDTKLLFNAADEIERHQLPRETAAAKYPRGFYGDDSVEVPRLTEDADMNARIERVILSMLDGDLTPPIMLRFTTVEQFNRFIRKVLVMGNVKRQPHG